MKKLILISLTAVMFSACKKDSADTTAPFINITSPTNHQSFTAGQTVAVTATVIDNDAIHMVHVYVRNKATSAEIVHVEQHLDEKSYNVSETFIAQAGVTYTIEVEAIDHSENDGKAEVEVSGI